MQTTHTPADTTLRMQAERIGTGRPVVLIGGGLTGWASWEPHAQRLAGSREVIRLQLLSVEYGLADRPLPDGYSVRTESRALAAALDDLDRPDPVDVAAWSFGALVALDFALNHPERVRTLTLIEPPALWTLPDHGRALPDVQALDALVPSLEEGDVTIDDLEVFVRTVALVPPGAEPESLPQWDSWVLHRRSLRNGSAPFRHDDDLSRLRDFRRPVLLVTGEGTSEFLRGVHDTLAARLPDVRTLQLPGGHAPHLAAMDAFLEAMGDFHDRAPRDRTATSADGTTIAYWESGDGPPLLLIHGATADHNTTWRVVREALEDHFTLYAMDRRGRGGSGDGPDYHYRREAEDVAAVVEAIGEASGAPVGVLGHSFGAFVALEAARLTPRIRRLILYEGIPLRGADEYRPELQERLTTLLEAGDHEGLLLALYRDGVGMPPEEIEMLRSQGEAWARRVANAPTMPRELAATKDYVFDAGRYADVPATIVLLVGAESPAREMRNARAIADALPGARIAILSGQQHVAMYTDPAGFVAEVVRLMEHG